MTRSLIDQILGSSPSAGHICGDGSEMLRYKACTDENYKALRASYETNGYTLYCEEPSGPILSATYVKDDEYAVLFYFPWEKQLHVTVSENGAKALPDQSAAENYTEICPVTLTQPKLKIQGMCEIFRLADGSFLVVDAGNKGDQDSVYNALRELNGSEGEIRVRVWLMTHTHWDHYGAFVGIARNYADEIKIDTVMYAPVNRDVIATIASYKTPWDGIEYFFNDELVPLIEECFPNTAICSVHAGQRFKLPGADLRILYTPEHLYIDSIPINMNHGSIVAQVVGEEGKALITGDSEHCSTYWVVKTYQEKLKSDIFQYPHHGGGRVPDPVLTVLTRSRAVLIPCTADHYSHVANSYTKMVENWEWTEATYIMGNGTVTLRLSGEKV